MSGGERLPVRDQTLGVRILGEQLAVDRSGRDRIDLDVILGQLDREVAREGLERRLDRAHAAEVLDVALRSG